MDYYIKDISIIDDGTLTVKQRLRIERRCRQRVGINFGPLKVAEERAFDIIGRSVLEFVMPGCPMYDLASNALISNESKMTLVKESLIVFSELDFYKEKQRTDIFIISYEIESVNKRKFIKCKTLNNDECFHYIIKICFSFPNRSNIVQLSLY